MIPRGRVLNPIDAKEGNYWELPDGEKQNQCPRRHIKEDPEWWQSVIMTYNAYEKGFLPGAGGIDDQPHLLVPLMATIASAIHDEEELERAQAQRKKAMANQSKGKAGPRSVLNGNDSGYAPVAIPKRGK